MSNKNCALIMAGGKGSRFWPQSTDDKPKQFLQLIGEKTMIQETYERINKKIPNNQIFVVTCERYKGLVTKQLPQLPKENIIIEPVGKNTAPCVLLACLYIRETFSNVNIAVFPSDHIISDTKEFLNIFDIANSYVEANNESIVTIGITPDRPETGYGYIKCSKEKSYINEKEIIKVERFVEKPDIETARQYLKQGIYLWNAGIFIFNNDFMLKEFKEKCSKSYNLLSNLPSIKSLEYSTKLKLVYEQCESISIDFAIMEKSKNIYVIPSNFGWDDIGTWKSIQRYIEPDESSNIIRGDVKAYNSKNNVIYAGNKKVLLIDIDNIFLIESDNLIAVGKKEGLEDIHIYKDKK